MAKNGLAAPQFPTRSGEACWRDVAETCLRMGICTIENGKIKQLEDCEMTR